MENVLVDVDVVFAFCRTCWDYKKIVFQEKILQMTTKVGIGKCATCQEVQEFITKDIVEYYNNLNKDNI